jgi:hypothetical protein
MSQSDDLKRYNIVDYISSTCTTSMRTGATRAQEREGRTKMDIPQGDATGGKRCVSMYIYDCP